MYNINNRGDVTPRLWHNIPHIMGGHRIAEEKVASLGVGYFFLCDTVIIVTTNIENENTNDIASNTVIGHHPLS